MNNHYLDATNVCRWKYRCINLRLRHWNNADKKFQQYKSLNFSNHPIRYSTWTTTVIWISTQPISNYYGDTENVITLYMYDTMLLDLIQTQVHNKMLDVNSQVWPNQGISPVLLPTEQLCWQLCNHGGQHLKKIQLIKWCSVIMTVIRSMQETEQPYQSRSKEHISPTNLSKRNGLALPI